MGKSRDAMAAAARARLPRSIWALGFVSLFMDISSEMVHRLIPVFLVTVIGASAVAVGLIEGVADGTRFVRHTGDKSTNQRDPKSAIGMRRREVFRKS